MESLPDLPSWQLEERKLSARLAKLPAEKLAVFIARLAGEDLRVARQAADLLASSQPGSLARRIQARFEQALAQEPHRDWHEAASLAADLHEVLDLIERELLPNEPAAAFASLADFIERDGTAIEMADDSDGEIGSVFYRACRIFASASKNVPSDQALPVWERLMDGNQYGYRDELSRLVADSLAAPEIAALVAKLREAFRTGGDDAFSAANTLQSIARARRDPDLYAEVAYRGEPRAQVPVIALNVARLYLEVGRPKEALEHLPPSSEGCWSASGDWYEVRAGIAQALGDVEGERRVRWDRFHATPNARHFSEALTATPQEEWPARRADALEFARRDTRDLLGTLRFFVDICETAEAARITLAHAKELKGGLYFLLVPLAEVFEADFPLASTAIYRALLDSILDRKKPNTYPHGAAYWHRLAALTARIETWPPLVPHETYCLVIRRQHGLKRAFWSAVDRHDPAVWAKEQSARKEMMERLTRTDPDEPLDEELF